MSITPVIKPILEHKTTLEFKNKRLKKRLILFQNGSFKFLNENNRDATEGHYCHQLLLSLSRDLIDLEYLIAEAQKLFSHMNSGKCPQNQDRTLFKHGQWTLFK